MVIGLLAIAAIPTVTGVGQAISAQKKQNAASREQEKCYMAGMLPSSNGFEDAGFCVLIGGQLFIDLPEYPVPGHKFCGYYFNYPSEEGHRGLVSTISDDPPMLNWIFVDKDTHAVRYGGRKDTIGHVIGPWGWSDDADGRFLTLQGNHAPFVARRAEIGGGRVLWGLYWDPDQEMLEALDADQCKPLRLHRKPVLGMESKYVRD
ncbi:hypothetical protein LIA77_00654 [Sarocladium implicatum]|nr:hypothetical protein LIA77_00654 [Sarocladium implicatum]